MGPQTRWGMVSKGQFPFLFTWEEGNPQITGYAFLLSNAPLLTWGILET